MTIVKATLEFVLEATTCALAQTTATDAVAMTTSEVVSFIKGKNPNFTRIAGGVHLVFRP